MANIDDAISLALALCRRFEGLRLYPYLCAAGVATVGIGSTHYEDGTKVTLLDSPITKERAEQLLQWSIKNVYLPSVYSLCPGASNPGSVAALVSFVYNLGPERLKHSTLRRRVNAGDIEGACAELMKWTKAGGRELKGLVLRRKAEVVVMQNG